MVAWIFGVIAGLLFILSAWTAWRYPHLRRMAWRNLWVYKRTTLLTMTGAMVGTALITSTLLLHYSIDQSIQSYFDKHYGPIAGLVKRESQAGIYEKDMTGLQEEIEKNGFNSILPTVSYTTTLMKVNQEGKPLWVQPQTYLHGFDYQKARSFDNSGMSQLLTEPGKGEIVLTKEVAGKLEVKPGEQVVALDYRNEPRSFTVSAVISRQGLTGYQGENGLATGMLSLSDVRNLRGISEGAYTDVLAGSTGKSVFDGSGMVSVFMNPWIIKDPAFNMKNELEGYLKFFPLFYIASCIAVVIGIVLILNIFRMLTEERKREWGVLRATGLSRQDLSRLLRLEGLGYALGSSLIGCGVSIGLSILLFSRLSEQLQRMAQAGSKQVIPFTFHMGIQPWISGLSVGVLLVYLCMTFIAFQTSRRSIVEILNSDGEKGHHPFSQKHSYIRKGISFLAAVLIIGGLILTFTSPYQDWIKNEEMILHFILSFLLVIGMVVLLLVWMPTLFTWILKGLQAFPRVVSILKFSFRFPEMNRIRTGLLIFMFAMVLFLTSFSGVVSASIFEIYGGFDSRSATGGYDLTAQTSGILTTKELRSMLADSKDIPTKSVEVATAVLQQSGDIEQWYHLNGVDQEFARSTSLKLKHRSNRYFSDRKAWEAVAGDPDMMIVDQVTWDSDQFRKYQIGDRIPISMGGKNAKKVIGVVRSQADHYPYSTTQGVWIQQRELLSQGKDNMETMILLRLSEDGNREETVKGLEKTFNLQNIFSLHDPYLVRMAATSFMRMFFTLFEGFSALGAVIGISGLMVVMYRVILERRQTIGMLRAIGLSNGQIFWSLFLEGTMIAMTGMALGIVMGSYTGYLLVEAVGEGVVEAVFPFSKLVGYMAGGVAITMLFNWFPARESLRYTPAEATRYIH